MVSLICCDKNFCEEREVERKLLHDSILRELGIDTHQKYRWGEVYSDYDPKSNISSINILYY